MDPANFDKMSRDELVAKARSLGVERPELMTRVELGDEIVRRTQTDPSAQQRARGWFGVARDLVASVVGSGLSMPDAAALIRGDRGALEFKGPSPVATVTLAEIYATQGHTERALAMVDEVLEREPEHPAALALRERLLNEPRARRAEAGQAKSSEPNVWSASASIDEEQAPRTSQSPANDGALEFSSPEQRAEPPLGDATHRQEVEPALDADGSAFEPVSLAPPLTDLPTRPQATPSDAAASPSALAVPAALAAEATPPGAEEVREPEPESEPFRAEEVREPESEPFRGEEVREPEPFRAEEVREPEPEPFRAEEVREPEPFPAEEPPFAAEALLAVEPEVASDAVPTPASPEPRGEPAALEPERGGELRLELESPPELAEAPSQPGSDIIPTLLPAADPEPEPEPVLIVVRRIGGDPLVCWDLPESGLVGGALELECHAFSAGPKGTERRGLTIAVESRRGSAVLPGLARATLIRVALGKRTDEAFVPIIIASELRQSGVSLDVSFRPPLSEPMPPTVTERGLIEQFAT